MTHPPTSAPLDNPPLVPGRPGRALALAYGCIIDRRNARYDARQGVVTLDRPVVSVGNLSVGGTGKTPMVAALARALLDGGRNPCIAMRGYASNRRSDGLSDEAAEYQRELPGVPIVARADRLLGLIHLFAAEEGERVDTVLLDDGFQHRRIARQVDIVLLDASRNPFTDRLLPAGWLREPVGSLARATHVVITHAELADERTVGSIAGLARAITGREPAIAEHAWAALRVAESGRPDSMHELSWLRSRRVAACCAIANPRGFLDALTCRHADVGATLTLGDHNPYSTRTLRRLRDTIRQARCEVLVTTEKDWSKLSRAADLGVPVARPVLEMRFRRGFDGLVRDVLNAAPQPEEDPAASPVPPRAS